MLVNADHVFVEQLITTASSTIAATTTSTTSVTITAATVTTTINATTKTTTTSTTAEATDKQSAHIETDTDPVSLPVLNFTFGVFQHHCAVGQWFSTARPRRHTAATTGRGQRTRTKVCSHTSMLRRRHHHRLRSPSCCSSASCLATASPAAASLDPSPLAPPPPPPTLSSFEALGNFALYMVIHIAFSTDARMPARLSAKLPVGIQADVAIYPIM